MSKRKIKFALIGCGRIAVKHAKLLIGMDNVELVAVSDNIQEIIV